MSHFVYKLIPPRPTFDQDMDEVESAMMKEHVAYWQGFVQRGDVLVFGPVSDPAGAWGLAVIETDSEADARALCEDDPAVKSGIATFEIYAMPVAVTRAHPPAHTG